MTEEAPGRGIRFRESMPKPLLIAFLGTAVAAVGLVVWLLVNPPVPGDLDIGSRRSPPSGTLTHDVVRAIPVDVPTPLPAFDPPCGAVSGIVIEGGEAAQGRIGSVLGVFLCQLDRDPSQPPEVKQAIRALSRAKVRFAVFRRTGEQSTTDLTARRIMINVDLARTSVDPTLIAPLLVHEGWHLSLGGPVSAEQEFGARVAEAQACRVVYRDSEPSRGCLDAQAIVTLGETRAIELLVRAGFPQ